MNEIALRRSSQTAEKVIIFGNIMDLLEKNAIDLIQLGFEDYICSEKDERRIFSSIRNIYSGIMLLFKAELIKRSPKSCDDALIKKHHSLEIVGDALLAKGKGELTIGLDDFIERFNCLGISVKDEVKALKSLKYQRNLIEHHYTDATKEVLENSVLDAFSLINKFNEKFGRLDIKALYSAEIWAILVDKNKNHENIRKECMSKWKKIDFRNISSRVFPIEQDDDPETILNFFTSIKCPNCRSDLIEPINYDFSKKTNVDMRCVKCDKHFYFSKIIEEILERHYAYEIFKVGSKGGVIPLSICLSCGLGTFLDYESVCIYCGNTKQGDYDSDYVNDLFVRNVNDYSDDIS